jgi:TRAP-type C4-dicarboxylate transport system permease small subunit
MNDGLERVALWAVIVLMAVMCAVTFAQAAGRYALHFSLTWSEELSRFMMVWISMLGGAVAARRRLHVGFEALTEALPTRVRRLVRAVALLLALAIFGFMAWYGVKLARFNMRQVSAALEWPMGVPYAAVPVGASLLVLFLLEELLRTVARRAGDDRAAAVDLGAGSSA